MSHVVAPDEAGKRADVVVARLSGMSRSLVADAVKRGDIRVNGEPVRGSRLLEAGDTLDFDVVARASLVVEPEAIDVPIVFEDADVIVVDKPAGMVTHPAAGTRGGTLVNALLAHAGSLPGDPMRAGLVHRLDRDTSGLLVVAKNDAALERLSDDMQARTIHREYLGLVHGVPEHPRGTLDGPIGRDPHNRLRYTIADGGKPAVTHYELRERLGRDAELSFRLETGRTHQIRVHLAALGHPIVNDPVYGRTEGRFSMPGQALHAWRLAFRHPRTGEDLTFVAEPPPEYVVAREMLRRDV